MDNPEFADVEWVINSGRYTFKRLNQTFFI